MTEPNADYGREREANRQRRAEGLAHIAIETYVPSKWRFLDLETGDVWRWDGTFKRADDVQNDGSGATDE